MGKTLLYLPTLIRFSHFPISSKKLAAALVLSLVVVDVFVDGHMDRVGLGDWDLDLLLNLNGVRLLHFIGDGLLHRVGNRLLDDLGHDLGKRKVAFKLNKETKLF